MKERKLTLIEIVLIAGTRVMLGAGLGLLLSTRLTDEQRRRVGRTLALIGGLTHYPTRHGHLLQTSGTRGEDPADRIGVGRV